MTSMPTVPTPPTPHSHNDLTVPLPVAAFDPRDPAGLDDIEQPPPSGATSTLDAISDRLMNRLQSRNFGTHESLILNHTVNVGTGVTLATDQAGVRYYELCRAPARNWTVNEQATCVVSSITSNEPQNGTGDGDTSPDWEIVSPTRMRLRAGRAGTGTGRVYTITVRCTDGRGNHTFRTTTGLFHTVSREVV